MSEITEALLHKLYVQEKKSLSQVGKIIGKSPKQISRYLKRFGIPARPFSTKGLKTWLGKTHSEETKQKIREKHLGKKLSEEHRLKVIKTLQNGSGELNPNWKGGRYITDQGYVRIRIKDRYELEHRVITNAKNGKDIHHLNGNKQDNRIENLISLSSSDHQKIHWCEEEKRKERSELMKEIRKKKFWSTKIKKV